MQETNNILFYNLLSRNDVKTIFNIVADIADLYIVGGAVRDIAFASALKTNIDVNNISDIDFCVNMPVQQFIVALKNKLKSYNNIKLFDNLMQYGVVRLSLNNNFYDITMFRTDLYYKNTRYPEVIYTPDIISDALRRDFSFNALYVDKNANLIAPLNHSIDDAYSLCVRFIDDVKKKIYEDPLRILRYIRMIHKVYRLKFHKNLLDCSSFNILSVQDIINFTDDYIKSLSYVDFDLFIKNELNFVKDSLSLLQKISFNKLKQEFLKFDM